MDQSIGQLIFLKSITSPHHIQKNYNTTAIITILVPQSNFCVYKTNIRIKFDNAIRIFLLTEYYLSSKISLPDIGTRISNVLFKFLYYDRGSY